MGRVLPFWVYRSARRRARRGALLRRLRLAFLAAGLAGAVVHTVLTTDLSEVGGALIATVTSGSGMETAATNLICASPRIVDGDTLDCAGARIRLVGIDAPEVPGHCRSGRRCVTGDPQAARAALARLSRGGVSCRSVGEDVYGRVLARCEAGGRDLSCAMIAAGHAERRYTPIRCPGR